MARNTIKRPFLHQSGDKFADLVEAHLKLVLPNITQTKRLGDLDRQGIDILQFQDGDGAATTAIQCKGYERPLNADHITGLVGEVRKYRKLGPDVSEYWLVINKPITAPVDRRTIETELATLVSEKKADKARLLDLDPFAQQLEAMAIEKFRSLAAQRREEMQQRYLRSFDNVGYIANVPSRIGEDEVVNPIKTIANSVLKVVGREGTGHTGKSRQYPRYFLTGSFGFGKTIGLHALGQLWADRSLHSIFIPAVSLHRDAFVNSAGVYDFIIGDLFANEEDFDKSHVGYKLLREACKSVLGSEPWMLLIDAIDESEFWTDPNRLSNLWFSIKEIGLPAVVSVRSELVDARPAEFSNKSGVGIFARVELNDWSSKEMDAFLKAFEGVHDGEPTIAFRKFSEVIQTDRYAEKYGDIPRRPLFLQMLAEDAWNGSDPEKKLFRLYGKYFRTKLRRDWERADSPQVTVRSSAFLKKFGIEEAQEQLVLLMQELALAAAGFRHDEAQANTPISLKTTQLLIKQKDLDRAVRTALGDVPMVEEILLNSLIQPAGRDSIDRQRYFRFAHQSFFDWFLARAIVQFDLQVSGTSEVTQTFVQNMKSALLAGESLP